MSDMYQELEYSSKTGRLVKNIKKTLVNTLMTKYQLPTEEAEVIAVSMLKVHGMSQSNFDFIKNVEQSISAQFKQDTTSGDVDPNSNKGERNIKQIYADALASFQKICGYDYLYRMLKEMYGQEEAKRLTGELYDYSLALSDSTQILSPYCYAADFSKLVVEGRPWGQVWSAPAKRVDSYVQQVLETTHEMSNHLAGAIAISTFFFDAAHLIIYKEGINTVLDKVTLADIKRKSKLDPLDKKLESLISDLEYNYSDLLVTNPVVSFLKWIKIPISWRCKKVGKVRKSLENIFQTVIHSVNHTSRNGAESPFTNISIFDRSKIRSVKKTLPHLFPETKELRGEELEDLVVEMIVELQNIYMDIFEKGDICRGGIPITFPVSTINLTKEAKDDGSFTVKEPEFIESIAKRKMYRYNVNVSAGNRVSMCCLDRNTEVIVRVDGKHEFLFIHEAMEKYPNRQIEVFHDSAWVKGTVAIASRDDKNMYKITTLSGRTMIATEDHIQPTDKGDVIVSELTTDHKLQVSPSVYHMFNNRTIYDREMEDTTETYDKIKSIVHLADYGWSNVYCFTIDEEYVPYFTLLNGIVTHNCRFSNDYDLMRSQAQTINSFGGEGIAIGSHRVNTINLKRIALETMIPEDFIRISTGRTSDALKILKGHKQLIKYMADKKLHKFISNGWINLENLFSTVGIIGTFEMAELLKIKFGDDGFYDMQKAMNELYTTNYKLDLVEYESSENKDPNKEPVLELYESDDVDYIELCLRHIEYCVDRFSREFGVYGNIEEIPGESMAVKLPKVDKLLYGEELVPEELYSNQFIPLWHNSTILERMKADGKYQQLLTGGGIVHFQVGSELTPNQNMNLINTAVECGCEHFASNIVVCECVNGHNTIADFKTEKCSVCGDDIRERRTRVVGFQTEVSNWTDVRRNWEAPRRVTYNLVD